jgi:hypothetical protein
MQEKQNKKTTQLTRRDNQPPPHGSFSQAEGNVPRDFAVAASRRGVVVNPFDLDQNRLSQIR